MGARVAERRFRGHLQLVGRRQDGEALRTGARPALCAACRRAVLNVLGQQPVGALATPRG